MGVLLGTVLLCGALSRRGRSSSFALGSPLALGWPSARDFMILGAILVGGLAAGLLPALRAYRLSITDGMMVKT
jgi:putative ABC transport system permease protein